MPRKNLPQQLLLLLKLLGVLYPSSSAAKEALETLEETPGWVNRVEQGCPKPREQLCALGHGSNYPAAAAHARQELAKVFGTKITAKFQLSTSYHHKTTEEYIQEDLAELTEQILKGVQITRRHVGNDGIYALAMLHRKQAGERLRLAMQERDQQLQSLIQSSQLSAVLQLRKLYNQRATLNQRHQFLRGHSVPEKITWEQIERRQKELANREGVISIAIEEKPPAFIRSLLTQVLTGVGFKVGEQNFRKQVRGTYSSQSLPLNIEGFEKYLFTLKLQTLNKQNQAIGSLHFDQEVTGRNRTQAASKAQVFMRDYLLEGIDQLNI